VTHPTVVIDKGDALAVADEPLSPELLAALSEEDRQLVAGVSTGERVGLGKLPGDLDEASDLEEAGCQQGLEVAQQLLGR
jgi:hypothetical protein